MSVISTNNNKLYLGITALLAGTTVATVILASRRLGHIARISSASEESSNAVPALINTDFDSDYDDAPSATTCDESLIAEQLARNNAFLPPGGLARLRGAFVIVIGCGGVGSHATAALARSGVGRIRLVDFDQVTLSSLNRHAVATRADVGLSKVRCLHRRLREIAPWVEFDLCTDKFDDASAASLLGPWCGSGKAKKQQQQQEQGDKSLRPTFVIDAIDNIDAKVSLLLHAHRLCLPIISSMGAACKSDPTRLVVGDISATTDDRLSRAVRRRLKLHGIAHGIPVVFSTEQRGPGKAEMLPLADDEFQRGNVGDLGVLPKFRVRILPVLGTMPALFGYALANHVLLTITGYPTDYAPALRAREKLYDSILAAVQSSEEKLVRATPQGRQDPSLALGLRIPLSHGEIAFLVDDIFRGRSVLSGLPTRLVLIRWRRPPLNEAALGDTPSSATTALMHIINLGQGANEQKASTLRLHHLVCMTKEEATRHQNDVLLGERRPEDIYDDATVEHVETRLKEAHEYYSRNQ